MDIPIGFNVHHLELFYYVARAGGITAALRLIPYGIQQPAVSLQMTQLEDAVGARLFQRKPFSLTPTGRQIFEFIAPFFGGLPQLASVVHGATAQHLRLAATANVMRDHFPRLLHDLQRLIPGLRLSLRDAPLDGAARLLREHEVDLALALHEGEFIASALRSVPLLTLPMVLLVKGDPPRGGVAAILRAAAEGSVPLIAPPGDDILTRRFHQELRTRHIKWDVRIEAPGLDLVEAYVDEGFGVGLGLQVPGRKPLARVRPLPLRGFPKLTYSAFWNERLTPLAQTCLDRMRVLAAEL
jgi:DNA-binding transcriptional LysR family regulator